MHPLKVFKEIPDASWDKDTRLYGSTNSMRLIFVNHPRAENGLEGRWLRC